MTNYAHYVADGDSITIVGSGNEPVLRISSDNGEWRMRSVEQGVVRLGTRMPDQKTVTVIALDRQETDNDRTREE